MNGHCFKPLSLGMDYYTAIDNHNRYGYLDMRCSHNKILKCMTLAFRTGSPHKAAEPQGDC